MIDFFFISNNRLLGQPEPLIIINRTTLKLVYSSKGAGLYLPDSTLYFKKTYKDKLLFIIGDLIGEKEKLDFSDKNPINILTDYPGLYYLLEFKKESVNIFNSVFGILPVYYSEINQEILISSKAHYLTNFSKTNFTLNKQYIFESTLFNHSLGQDTPWQEIKLLPANSALNIKDCKIKISKYLKIEDYFTSTTSPWRTSINEMAEYFIHRSKDYFKKEQCKISFTGGFDGRTLLACAICHGADYQTYSFGSSTNKDITIPLKITQKLNLPFTPIYLDTEEYLQDFLKTGQELIEQCDGNNNFLHVHYLYSLKKLVNNTCLVNGMFGSELMRALHVSGQVTSRPLVNFFLEDYPNRWMEKILGSDRMRYLNQDLLKNEIIQLKDKLINYKGSLNQLGLTKNQQFYKFIFEETFRKIFGAFIIPQLRYTKIRAPYLDFKFIKRILQTELAGVNNDFYTHNPLKRYKGQKLYARIIQKAYKPLLYELNDKGYKPVHLLNYFGLFNISLGYFKKRIHRKFYQQDYDNLGILSAFDYNNQFFKDIKIPDLLNKQKISKMLKERDWYNNILERDNLIRTLSLVWFINKEFNL